MLRHSFPTVSRRLLLRGAMPVAAMLVVATALPASAAQPVPPLPAPGPAPQLPAPPLTLPGNLAQPASAQPTPTPPAPTRAVSAPSPTPAAQPSPTIPEPAPSQPSPAPTPAPLWVVNFTTAPMYAAPTDESESFGTLRQFTYLEVLGYDGEWAHVFDPRTRARGYVSSFAIGPADVPPAYITASPPPAVEDINREGRIVRTQRAYMYPTPEDDASVAQLTHNTAVTIADAVTGTDGETWYRSADGDYFPQSAIRLATAPPRAFPGRWIDVDLSEPAMLVAYEDDVPVLSTLVIKGAGAFTTPTGVFSIRQRVADETMSSETIGIPRNGPGGYHLEHVLFTQYFLPTGESIHYNYWSSNFGFPGSHGCLGLSYRDSEFLWTWASLGTPVSIHY